MSFDNRNVSGCEKDQRLPDMTTLDLFAAFFIRLAVLKPGIETSKTYRTTEAPLMSRKYILSRIIPISINAIVEYNHHEHTVLYWCVSHELSS
jgi:hypothetical protein